ncbi:MAG: DUF2179 domain-containing protein [bacterium]
MEAVLGGLLVFWMRTCDMSLGTLRMFLIVQGRRYYAAAVGFVEVTIFILAISKVIGSITDVWHVLGYSGGFAFGTFIGISIEERLSLGYSLARIVSRGAAEAIAAKLWANGFGASVIDARGKEGPVKIIHSLVRRRQVKSLLSLVESVDPKAFITLQHPRSSLHGYLNPVKKR